MKTFSPRPQDIERRWYVLDAGGAVLGRVASQAAKILRGKHKPIFTPHADTGDHVIVINARGLVLTGGKEEKKIYYRHSGYPGGLRAMNYARILTDRPVLAVEKAVRGMLPKNRLGRQMFRKLAVYEGPDHPHQAQKPVSLGLNEVPKWEGLPKPTPKIAPRPKAAPKAQPTAAASKKSSARKAAPRGRAGGAARPVAATKGPSTGTRASGAEKPEGRPKRARGEAATSASAGEPAPEKRGTRSPRRPKSKIEEES